MTFGRGSNSAPISNNGWMLNYKISCINCIMGKQCASNCVGSTSLINVLELKEKMIW